MIKFQLASRKRKRPTVVCNDTRHENIFQLDEQEDQNSFARSGNLQARKIFRLEDKETKLKRLQNEGNILAEAGKFRTAIARWLEAVEIEPNSPVLYELLAQAYMAIHDDFKAIQFASKAIECDAKWGEAYQTLARCHFNYGELELAHQHILKAIEIMGSNAELQEDLDDITTYLERQKKVFEKRDKELEAETDEDKLQVISCMKNLCLRGKATNI